MQPLSSSRAQRRAIRKAGRSTVIWTHSVTSATGRDAESTRWGQAEFDSWQRVQVRSLRPLDMLQLVGQGLGLIVTFLVAEKMKAARAGCQRRLKPVL